jgi:hypothetical protein
MTYMCAIDLPVHVKKRISGLLVCIVASCAVLCVVFSYRCFQTWVFRYEIALVATDGTEEAEFILRGDNGEQLIGMPVLQVIVRNCSFWVNPLRAAAHMQYPSPEFAAVVSNKYMFVVSVSEGSFYRPRPSFEVTAIKHVPSISSAQP